MKNYLKVELMKIKRTSIQKAIFLIPFSGFILAASFNLFGGIKVMELTNVTAINHWGVLWLPTSVALLGGIFHTFEMKSTGYQTIDGFPISQRKVWLAKNLVISISILISTLILWLLICIHDLLLFQRAGSLIQCLSALLLSWFSILWQIPFYLMLAKKINYFVLIILSFGLGLVGTGYAVKAYWWAIPWTWTSRFQAPIIRVHPNGLPLEANSELLSYSGFLLAITLAVILLLAFLLIGRKDDR